MREDEIRLACFELAVKGNNPRGTPAERAEAYAQWIGGAPIRLGCLRLASQTHGNLARIGAEGLLAEAQKILHFVSVEAPIEEPQPKRRGRPKKS